MLMARCLIRNGADITFVMRDYVEGVVHARQSGMNVVPLPLGCSEQEERIRILTLIDEVGADWLVFDLPYEHIDAPLFDQCRFEGVRTLFMDDARFTIPKVDVFLNSSILAQERITDVRGVRTFLGPEFFVWDGGTEIFEPAPWKQTILLSFGGADPTGLTARVVSLLCQTDWQDTGFWVMLGPGFSHTSEIREMVSGNAAFFLIENTTDPYVYFRSADLTVCSGGRTMYELTALGKRFVAVASAVHEQEPVMAFAHAGHALVGFEEFDGAALLCAVRKAVNGET